MRPPKIKPPSGPTAKEVAALPLASLLQLPVGPTLDCAVAHHLVGWQCSEALHKGYYFRHGGEIVANTSEFKPSAHIGDAIQVLRAINERGRSVRLVASPCAAQWLAMVNGDYTEFAPFEDLPLAICRAGLRACLETGGESR